MQLDPRELELLARFFAKRFPTPGARFPMLEAAGLLESDAERPTDAWLDILKRAQAQGALEGLGCAVRSDDPDDTNLREVRRLLVGEPKLRWSVAAAGLGAAAGLLLVFGGGVTWAAWSYLATPASPAPTRVATAATKAATTQPPAAPVAPAPAAAPAVPAVLADAEPREASPPPEPPAASAPESASEVPAIPVTDLPPRRHLTADHCFRMGPEVHGFWYAGDHAPGRVGDVIVVPNDVYVRAEAPSAKNDYDTRTPVQCVLYEGDRIKLSEPPVLVPVDAWWVGMSGEDIVVAGGQQVQSQVAGR